MFPGSELVHTLAEMRRAEILQEFRRYSLLRQARGQRADAPPCTRALMRLGARLASIVRGRAPAGAAVPAVSEDER